MPQRVIEVVIKADSQATAPLKSFSSLLSSLTGIASAPTKALDGLVTTAAKIGLAAQGVGMLVGAVQSLAGAMAAPITAASNLAESMNKTEVVFGASADAVKRFAETAATGLGQSQQTALEAAGTFGNLFTSMGLGQKPAADLSTNIVRLASDLASFNNIKPEEALEKLRAGLVGEVEPLRTVGVNLNALAVEARATALGFVDANGVVTEAGKVQARYALILEQTKNAQGDFARTADGFANAQRIVAATFVDINAQIGAAFLPTIAKLTTAFATVLPSAINLVMPIVEQLGAAFVSGVGQVQGFITMVQNISRDHGLGVFQSILVATELKIREVFGDRASQLFHGFVAAIREIPQIADRVGQSFSGLAPTAERVGRLIETLATFVGDLIQPFIRAADEGREMSTVTDRLGGIMDGVVGIVNDFTEAIENGIGFVRDHADEVHDLGAIIATVAGGFIAAKAAALAMAAAHGIQAAATGLAAGATRLLNAAMAANPIGILITLLGALAGVLIYAYATNEDFRSSVDVAWERIKAAVGVAVPWVIEKISGLNDFLVNFGPTVSAAAWGIGVAITTGIRDALTAGWTGLVQKLTGLVNLLPQTVKDILGISSPSRVFAVIGGQIVEGLAGGIEQSTSVVTDAMNDLASTMHAVFTGALTPIEKENEDHLDRLESAERKHNRRVQDEEQKLATAKPAARKAILDRIRELEEDHAQSVEDIERTHADNLIDAEMKMARERGAAIVQYARDAEDAAQDAADRIVAINERQASAMQSATDDAIIAMADARSRASEQIDSAIGSLRDNRAMRGVRDEFGTGQDKASRARQDEQDLAALVKRSNESQQDFIKRSNEATADLIHRRELEDAAERRSLDKDLAKAKTDDERSEIQDRHAATRDELREKRTLEDTERRYQYDQDKAAVDSRVSEMRDEYNERKKAAEDDRLFREGQSIARQKFEDQLDTDALGAAITRINTERDAKIDAIKDALTNKQAALIADANAERGIVNQSLADKLADLKANFIDKLGPLTATAQGVLDTFMDNVAGRVSGITAAALAAAAALAQIGAGGSDSFDFAGAANNIGASVGNAVANAISAGATAAQTAAALLNAGTAATGIPGPGGTITGYASGAVGGWNPGYATGTLRVPGKPGEATMVVAHGGERISSWTADSDTTPVQIVLNGQIIAQSTWRELKRQRLVGTSMGLT